MMIFSVRYSIYCTVFKEIISQQGSQYNISLCLDVWLHFHLKLGDQGRVRQRESDWEKEKNRGNISHPQRAVIQYVQLSVITVSHSRDSLIRQGMANTVGWIMDNNLQQSVDNTEHDFLISMGYLIKMKCFPELLTNCLGTRWRQNNPCCYMKRHLKNCDGGKWTLLSVCGLY